MPIHGLRVLLGRLLVLAAIAFAGDRLAGYVLRPALLRSQIRFSRVARGGLPAEVLMIGDSRGVNGFYSPEISRRLGAPAMNFGFNSMSTLVEEALLRDYLRWNAPPRLLVLEVSNVAEDHILLGGLMCYWDSYPALGALADQRSPRNRAATRVSHLFAFNGEVPLRAIHYRNRSDQDWINHYHMEPALLRETRVEPDFDLETRDENLAALGRITRLAAERGIEVRLVLAPYLPAHAGHIRNMPAWLERIRFAAGGVEPIWNYAHAISDSSLFADRVHLNYDGAAPFIDLLERDGFFRPGARPPAAAR